MHPVKIDYKIKKMEDGTWDKDKVRCVADTSHTWDSNEPVYEAPAKRKRKRTF